MKVILAALLAAIVSFAWGACSWMVMDWHQQGLRDFKNEAAVAEVIKANATHGTGVYMLPYPRKAVSYADPAEKENLNKSLLERKEAGPFVYATVRPGKLEANMPASLAWSFGRSFLAALLLGALLHQTVLAFPARLAFCAAAGLFAAVVCLVPERIWFELPLQEVMVGTADCVIEWTLAGVVLALFLGKEPTDHDLR
jgi:hypothetical protein